MTMILQQHKHITRIKKLKSIVDQDTSYPQYLKIYHILDYVVIKGNLIF